MGRCRSEGCRRKMPGSTAVWPETRLEPPLLPLFWRLEVNKCYFQITSNNGKAFHPLYKPISCNTDCLSILSRLVICPFYTLFVYRELHADLPTLSPTAAPLFSEIPVDMMADVGENVTLPCVAHGFPLPKVTWHRDDGRPILTNVDSSGSQVQLEKGHLLIQSESFPLLFFTIFYYPAIAFHTKAAGTKRPEPPLGPSV